ncbi:aspartate aminotransferase family protein [Aquimarina sp. 2304DJ70-9]|uniref:aspartate aminotransferase family protein n=1 Tax=Aquimarina penaris TaxID=3231044 RepID=UPI003462BF03
METVEQTKHRSSKQDNNTQQINSAATEMVKQTNYSITEYHDINPIYKKLQNLVDTPVVNLPKKLLDTSLRYFDEKCVRSKNMIDRAKEYIPGGVQHNLAFNYPYPIVFDKAEGAYLYDIDGNRYIDFLQAGGPTVLGSNPKEVREKAIEVLNTTGPSTGLFHEYEYKLAKLICEYMPSVEKFRMLNSGSESVIAAVRIARLATGKKKVIKIGGAYHGWMDQMVYGTRIPRTGRFEAHGIPRAYTKHTQEVYPNNLKALERKLLFNTLRGGTAAIILEPLGTESGTRPVPKGYNQKVRNLCDKYGALLIFDEVVTAFRVGMQGAQGYFNVMPDLTVFGKVVAGGYPSAGGIGGKNEYMKYLAAGLDGDKKIKKAKVGGTMAANPLSCVAGYYTLKNIIETDACVKAGKAGDRLCNGLQAIIDKHKLPYVTYNQGSIVHLETSGVLFIDVNFAKPWTLPSALKQIKIRKDFMEQMGAVFMSTGIVTIAGSRLYTSAAQTDKVIDEALTKFERIFKQIAI